MMRGRTGTIVGLHSAAAVAITAGLLTLASCGIGALPGTTNGTAGPTPTPIPNTVLGVCGADLATLRGMYRQLDASVTSETLVRQGTLMASITGILATDIQRISTLPQPEGDPKLMTQWLSELQAAIGAGVDAVHASAAGDVGRFRRAAIEAQSHRQAARPFAAQLGYGSCPF
jgi:hypothetical protein